MKRALVLASGLLLLTLIVAVWKTSRGPRPVMLVPALTGEPEYCLTCHADLPQISPSHPVEKYGCIICHGGERLALDADLAHSTMRGGRNPSDPAVVEASCGGAECHSGPAAENRDQIPRVMTNVQMTYAGALAALRYAAGAQPDLVARVGIAAVEVSGEGSTAGIHALEAFDPAPETSPMLQTFAQNCLVCHLAAQPLPGPQYARFTGCAACHAQPVQGDLSQTVHRLNTDIAYSQCNTCHNRGSYDVPTVQFRPRTDQPANRQQAYYLPGAAVAKCEFRLDCVDCHTRREVMGDGALYDNQAETEYLQCRTCHGTLTEPPLTRIIEQPADFALQLASSNLAVRLQVGDTIIVTAQGEPLWNTRRLPDGRFEQVGKVTGQHHIVPLVMGSGCQQTPAEQQAKDCHACHTAK